MEYWIPLLVAGCLAVWYYRSTAAPRSVAPAPPPPAPPVVEFPRGGWQCLVGRRIESVVVAANPDGSGNRHQVFLVVEGEMHFEIYSSGEIRGVKGLWPSGLYELVCQRGREHRILVYGPVPAPENQGG